MAAFDDVQCRLDALMGRVYRRYMDGDDIPGVLRYFCQELCRLNGFSLVVLLHKLPQGSFAIEAVSDDNGLHAALLRAPERWDACATGDGPAGRCIRQSAPQVVGVSDIGFNPWRNDAVRDLINAVIAWPVPHGAETHVLEIFSTESVKGGAVRELSAAAEVAKRLGPLLDDLARLEFQHLLTQGLEAAGNAAFMTDLDGTIRWCNKAFQALSGYPAEEVIGKNPRLLKSGEQGLRYYRELWATIRAGKVWSAETVDKDRDGVPYTIRQTISPVSVGGRITHYLSIHDDVTRLKAVRDRLERDAGIDSMTGLMTPGALKAEIQKRLEAPPPGEPFTLGLLSVRDFAETAATLGPETGDSISATLGGRLLRALAPGDMAAALEPGEYLLLLRGDPEKGAGREVVGRLHEAVDKPLPLLGDHLHLQHRVSFARYPEHGTSFDTLLRHADRRLADEPFQRARRQVAHDSKLQRH